MNESGFGRRELAIGAASLAFLGIAGCLGDDDSTDEDEMAGADDGVAADLITVEVPAELPTDPDEDDYLDRTGQDTVVIVTRAGDEGEPDYVFDPPFVAVEVGTTVRWENHDDAFHTVTSVPDLAALEGGGDVFDEEIAAAAESFEWDATSSGRFHYYCRPHTQFMWGSVAVLDDGGFPTADEPAVVDDADDLADDVADDSIDDVSGDEHTDDENDSDDEPEDEDYTDVPEELPTDPDEDDFVDETGADEVTIITRRGRDGEPNFVFDPPFVLVDAGATVR